MRLGMPDASGRKAPEEVKGADFSLKADLVIKALGFDTSVNVTLGLPFIRTSPDHGTAFGIAGQGVARETSLVEAIKLAGTLSSKASA